MKEPLHVLIIEDSESDAALISRLLERAGYDLVHERVDTPEEMTAALESGNWDVIVADFSMPRFDAPSALKLLQKTGRDIPFIVVSGSIGEDTAVSMMKAGAHDYVMKDNLARLAPAVSRELGDAATRRKNREAEEALLRSEERMRTITDSLPVLIAQIDTNRRYIFVNSRYESLFPQSTRGPVGKHMAEVIGGPAWEKISKSVEVALSGEKVFCEYDLPLPDGKISSVYSHFLPHFNAGGEVESVYIWQQDITELKQAEQALQQQAEFQQQLVNALPTAVFYKDVAGRYLGCNTAFERLLKRSRDEIIGRKVHDLAPAENVGMYLEQDSKLLNEPGTQVYDTSLRDHTGAVHEVLFYKATFPKPDGSLGGIIGSIVDITERKRAEEEHARLATAIEQSAEAIIITDTDWIISYVNPSFEHMNGYSKSEIVGRHLLILASEQQDESFYENIRRTLSKGEVWSGRLTNKRKDGALYDADVNASPVRDKSGSIINYVIINRDITREVRLEKELRQAQKMEALGTLAGGIAHDFNNILTAMIGFTDMARFNRPRGIPVDKCLDHISEAGMRAADLVKQILTFSRRTEQERRPVRIDPIIKEALRLLRSSLPSTIEIYHEIEASAGKDLVLADPTQIHQILMNLCTNAAHAMREKGGALNVGLFSVVPDYSLLSLCPELKPGRHVCLSVSDTGHGMSAELLERIFDPYFTTKGQGEGTGLGLAVVQGIVKNYGGAITVSSKPGVGTVFQVLIPIVEEKTAPKVDAAEELIGGAERVLFVDDEQLLVSLGEEMLQSLGYRVTAMATSLEALEEFRAHPQDFDLVITDMTMPNLTGLDLAREILAIRPDLPVILATGFSEIIDEKRLKEFGIRQLLMKPYSVSNLAVHVRKALE